MNWKGVHCSVCDKPLQESDDIVVCPECGAPYHRACYQEKGACVFAAKHGAGFEYKRPAGEGEGETHRCPNCGTPNAASNLFCENCGVPLANNAPSAVSGSANGGYQAPQQAQRVQFPGIPDETAQVLADNGMLPRAKEYDGIPTADWIQYIGNSAPYYLFQFDRMDATHRKTSVCWSALLLGPIYFLYRKMWSWGIFSTLLMIVVNIPGTLYMLQLMNLQVGFVLPQTALTGLSMVCVVINWAASVLFALFAFTLFRKHAAKKLQSLKQSTLSEEEYQQKLSAHGGPSRVAVAAFILLVVAASAVFYAWIGPENLNLYNLYY